MKINAWIQMGSERREVNFDVSEAEIERVGEEGFEMYIEAQVLDWIASRYGWGWSCDLMTEDLSYMEDGESGRLVVTDEVLNPRTQRLRVHPRAEQEA